MERSVCRGSILPGSVPVVLSYSDLPEIMPASTVWLFVVYGLWALSGECQECGITVSAVIPSPCIDVAFWSVVQW